MAEDDKASGSAPAGRDARETDAEDRYARELIDRGDAARAVDGRLPPGATHEIVDDAPGRPPKVVRRRFSLSGPPPDASEPRDPTDAGDAAKP
jgi:hypothetical protein